MRVDASEAFEVKRKEHGPARPPVNRFRALKKLLGRSFGRPLSSFTSKKFGASLPSATISE